MRTTELAQQLRWWAGEGRRRAFRAAVRIAPPAVRADLVYALETRDGRRELTLTPLDPHRTACVVEEHLVADSTQHVVPAGAGLPSPEGIHWGDRYVYRLTDCAVDLETGLVFHGGRVLRASGGGWRTARDGAFLSGAGARAEAAVRRAPGPIAPMGRAHNYYHFILETLPRLLHVHRVAPDAVPVFAAPMPAFAVDVLDTLAISYRVVDPVALLADDVWLCDPVPTNWPHPDDLTLLRSVVAAAVPPSGDTGPRRVYVSRRGASRPIADEARVEDMVTARGFVVADMSSLSFADQVRVVRDAEVVIAPHGAGLTGVLFCQEGTAVLELTTGDWWNPCYRYIASIAGLTYRLLLLPWSPEHPDGTASDAIAVLAEALAELDP